MEAADAEMLQALYVNSGLLDLLSSFADVPEGVSKAGALSLHGLLFRADVVSAVLSSVGAVLDVVNIVSIIATVATGGSTVPFAAISIGVTFIITIVDYVIDTVLPTDLKRPEGDGYPLFRFPELDFDLDPTNEMEVIFPDITVSYPILGAFTNDSQMLANTFSALVSILTASIMDSAGFSPDSADTVREEINTFIEALCSSASIDAMTYFPAAAGAFAADEYLVDPPIWVELNTSLYALQLDDVLTYVFPATMDLISFFKLFDRLGINPGQSQSQDVGKVPGRAWAARPGMVHAHHSLPPSMAVARYDLRPSRPSRPPGLRKLRFGPYP